MLNHLTGGQEVLCINTEKVYDWVLNEATFDLDIDGLVLPINTVTGAQLTCDDIDLNNVTCEVIPAEEPFVILDREDQLFVVDGAEVTLQVVHIRKCFDVVVYAELIPELGGGQIEVGTATFNRCEQVILCAPEGTDIDISFTDLDCFVCSVDCDTNPVTEIDELDVTLTVRVCQSIQSTFCVTIEVEADFCQPRDILPVPPCPAPAMPAQCPVVFPAMDRDGAAKKKKSSCSAKSFAQAPLAQTMTTNVEENVTEQITNIETPYEEG
ncbi:hypothetical protein SH601_11505 [Gracilibacillus sp. S3-1-1]|uniref:Uncharacterized protein n=1 Tax=Gracilibacillus pellucidus TaxID=3095368 RepID=A0ACC6M6W6_9BACI|nr:hypothetical protein [Gracilibacillus sp. S3-1-1]MDX8046608.1 hypothetical protein [Gracilibacillus sp. S3-1-1]